MNPLPGASGKTCAARQRGVVAAEDAHRTARVFDWPESPAIEAAVRARNAMPTTVVRIAVCATALLASQEPSPKIVFSNPPPSEMVKIDGSKNPELIPQWSVWSFAFRVIAGGTKAIPTAVLVHLSKEEAELLRREADVDVKNDADCRERVLRLVPLLQKEDAKTINEKTREINLDCRWRTLGSRDRVLAGLTAEGQAALSDWVESNKAGMQVSVPKRELSFFRQPQ
jgi:hypothetical protein